MTREKHDAECRRRKLDFPYLCTCGLTGPEIDKSLRKEPVMTQLPRIGDKVSHFLNEEEAWNVYGLVRDFESPTLVLLEMDNWKRTCTAPAASFWQHWTPATQRDNP